MNFVRSRPKVLALSFRASAALHIASSCLGYSHVPLHTTVSKPKASILGLSPAKHPLKNALQIIGYSRYYSSTDPKETHKHAEAGVSFQRVGSLNRLRVGIRERRSRQPQQVFNPSRLISNISLDAKSCAHFYALCRNSEHFPS